MPDDPASIRIDHGASQEINIRFTYSPAAPALEEIVPA